MEKYDYSVIEVKHRFSIKRSLDDYKVTTFDKVIRTGYKRVFTCPADNVGKILFCISYRNEKNELQYQEFDIREWAIKIVHCTQFAVEF